MSEQDEREVLDSVDVLTRMQTEIDELRVENQRLRAGSHIEAYRAYIEALSARLHDIYQKEAHRRGDVRHDDAYANLPEPTKEWDRVLARWIVQHWRPTFDPADGLPEA